MEWNETWEGIMPSQRFFEWVFDTFKDGVIACDLEGNILRINAAALQLFEVASPSPWSGKPYQQFLHRYEVEDKQDLAHSLESWLMSLLNHEGATSGTPEELKVFQVSSERKVYVTSYCLPVLDAQQQEVGTIRVFHDITRRHQKALQLQRVHQSVLSLIEAIAYIPEHLDFAFAERPFLLSPSVVLIAQHLVEVVRHVLNCRRINLWAISPQTGHLHYVASSGLSAEQEQKRREMSGFFLPSAFIDETVLARLSAKQEVLLPADRLRIPFGFSAIRSDEQLLLIPLLLDDQLVGGLVIARARRDSAFSSEEIELAKAVAAETMCIIECLRYLHAQTATQTKALVQQEMHHLIDEFLNLASHELNTPLTAIKGNIQLAQRRLTKLKCQFSGQHEHVSEQIEQIQYPLTSAAHNARLQERMIQNILDDVRIQANTLDLHLKRCDLAALLEEAVANQQKATPECMVLLEITPAGQVVPILADDNRIRQVINSYLANALSYSPVDQPVTIQLALENAQARVSVHDEGPSIGLEEQGRVWQRFSYARRISGHSELDMSLGLGFYLCRAFIELHHGSVGVQSDPGHGATFWFTLPLAAATKGEADT